MDVSFPLFDTPKGMENCCLNIPTGHIYVGLLGYWTEGPMIGRGMKEGTGGPCIISGICIRLTIFTGDTAIFFILWWKFTHTSELLQCERRSHCTASDTRTPNFIGFIYFFWMKAKIFQRLARKENWKIPISGDKRQQSGCPFFFSF